MYLGEFFFLLKINNQCFCAHRKLNFYPKIYSQWLLLLNQIYKYIFLLRVKSVQNIKKLTTNPKPCYFIVIKFDCWTIFQQPTSLMVWVLKGEIFLSLFFYGCWVGRNPFHLWRNLIWGRKVLEQGVLWWIGDETFIKIYKDAWMLNSGSSKVSSQRVLYENGYVEELLTLSGG